MISRKRKRKISLTKIRKLRKLYLLGISIRKAASVVKVNKITVERYFRGYSDAICKCAADNFCKSSGEVEVDESYSAKRPLGLAGVERVREAGGKVAVIGAISRGGIIQAQIIEQASTGELNSFICNTIEHDSVVYTGSYTGYNR